MQLAVQHMGLRNISASASACGKDSRRPSNIFQKDTRTSKPRRNFVTETKKERTNLVVMVGGEAVDRLPVSIARDGALARRAELKASLKLDLDFEKKLAESNKLEEQLRVEKENATRRKELASTRRARE